MEFDVQEFRNIHGSHIQGLSKVSDSSIEFWAKAANMILGLDKESCIIKDEEEKKMALQLIVCHIGNISVRGLVGMMSNASEGSVSVGTQIPPGLTRSWICGTPCGLLLWNLMQKYMRGPRWYPYQK